MRPPFFSSGRPSPWTWALLCLANGAVARNASFIPSAIPLAVKSPYLSAWLIGTNVLNAQWPNFWRGDRILGWAGYAVVDGNVYNTMGTPNQGGTKTQQIADYRTATSSVFVMKTPENVVLTYTFLSPITPDDLVRQSIPFSYLYVTAASADGLPHKVTIYSDISAEWVSSDEGQAVNWTTNSGQNSLTHKIQLQTSVPFAETLDRIQDGAVFHSVMAGTGAVTYQTGEDSVVRNQFQQNRTLANVTDPNFRGIGDKWPVFAFSVDLGTVLACSKPAAFAVGHARDPVAQFTGTSGSEELHPFFASQYAVDDLPDFVVGDLQNAVRTGSLFDNEIEEAARNVSNNYFEILALTIRQALGAVELAISKTDNGWDTDNPMLLVKDISHSATVTPVEAVYAMWPMFRYLSPSLGRAAIEPVLNYARSASRPYSPPNLGTYPNATSPDLGTGNPDMPIEATADIIIMALDAAQQTNDTAQLARYFDLLKSWADYLVAKTLHPGSDNTYSADAYLQPPIPDQTGLALKGILGIAAMSAIANITNNSAVGTQYAANARDLVQQWHDTAFSKDSSHLTLDYGDDPSWALAYNLYMDRLLNLILVPGDVYETQNRYYQGRLSTNGFPIDSRTPPLSSSVWNVWIAALAPDDFRAQIIDTLGVYAGLHASGHVFADVYNAVDGNASSPAFNARPHVGGHLAILALPESSRPLKLASSATPSLSLPNRFSPSVAYSLLFLYLLL